MGKCISFEASVGSSGYESVLVSNDSLCLQSMFICAKTTRKGRGASCAVLLHTTVMLSSIIICYSKLSLFSIAKLC